MPLNVLKGGAGQFGRWSREAARKLDDKARIALEDRLADIEETWIRRIDDYRFPVVTLSDKTEADAVCTIFETLNRTGVKLSPFELLTARFWPQNVNLRALWARAQADYPIIADFEVDPYYVVQAIALIARPTPSCKRGDVLNLESADIERHWTNAAAGLGKALQIIREDCGVIVAKWLPYNTIVIPLAALLTKRPIPAGPEAADVRNKLVRWYWCSVFGQSYENAPNSQAAKDVSELLAWLDGGNPPASVAEFKFDPRTLRDTTVRQRALYRGAICLTLRNHPRDFHSGQLVTGDLIADNHIDDHHIFPDNFLRGENVASRLRDSVLNRTLIDRATNIRISDKAPSVYMAGIRAAIGHAKFAELLGSHFIPYDDGSPLWSDDYNGFIAAREAALWEQIKQVTGVAEASDLVERDEDAA